MRLEYIPYISLAAFLINHLAFNFLRNLKHLKLIFGINALLTCVLLFSPFLAYFYQLGSSPEIFLSAGEKYELSLFPLFKGPYRVFIEYHQNLPESKWEEGNHPDVTLHLKGEILDNSGNPIDAFDGSPIHCSSSVNLEKLCFGKLELFPFHQYRLVIHVEKGSVFPDVKKRIVVSSPMQNYFLESSPIFIFFAMFALLFLNREWKRILAMRNLSRES